MRYSQLRSAMLTQFRAPNGHRAAYFILGKPGGGKSALARDVAYTLLRELGVDEPRNNVDVIEFNASLRDPVDIMGTPNNTSHVTKWVPPEEFYNISREARGDKPAVLILEELSDAPMAMQNPLCRVIYDRYAGQLELAPNLFIIATGNRTEDKSGANRISTKLGNRMRMHDFDENVDDWTDWAARNDIHHTVTSFIKFRPNLLSDFNPDRRSNPTPRSWADVSRIPADQSEAVYLAEVKACVGEGAAVEFMGFRRVSDGLVSYDEIVKKPKTAQLPTEASALYAMTGMLSSTTTLPDVPKVAIYIARMSADFQTLFWTDAMKRNPTLNTSAEFREWITKNAHVFTS